MKPGKKADRSERMKAVEREYLVAEKALAALEEALERYSGLLTSSNLSSADLRSFRTRLHDTYFIRLFAEFETGIKDYWKNGLSRDGQTRIMDVIESLASKHAVLDIVRFKVHAARQWRNRLIHEGDATGEPVKLAEARSYLGRYLGYLPNTW
jgi:hypothetical protein